MTVATLEDVKAALLRDPDPTDEVPYVQPMLDYVEASILLTVPDALDRVKARKPYETVLKRIEAECVCRVLRAPAGGVLKYETEGSYTYSVNTAIASGLLEVRPAEMALLVEHPGGWAAMTAEGDGYLQYRRGLHQEGSWVQTTGRQDPPDPPPSDLAGVTPWGDW